MPYPARGCGPSHKRALANVLVLAAVFLAHRPTAHDSCSLEASSVPPSAGSPASACPGGGDESSAVDDGASLMQLHEAVARRASGREAAAPSEAPAAAVQAASPQGNHSSAAIAKKAPKAQGAFTQGTHASAATAKTVLEASAARPGPEPAGKVADLLELARRRRESIESLFGHSAAFFGRKQSQLVVIIVVALAVAGGAISLILCMHHEESARSREGRVPQPGDAVPPMQSTRTDWQQTHEPQGAYAQGAYAQPASRDNTWGQPAGGKASPARPAGASRGSPPRQTAPGAALLSPPTTGALQTGTTGMGGGLAPQPPLSPPPALCPDLPGSVVPADSKFLVKVPPLLHLPRSEMSQRFDVMTAQAQRMFELHVQRHAPSSPTDKIEEYFHISLPGESHKELAACSFGRPRGPQLECEIFRSEGAGEADFFGIISEEPGSAFGTKRFALRLQRGRRLLSVLVKGDVKDRAVKIVSGDTSEEIASTVPGDTGQAHYEVECYPYADVILVVITLAAVDRLSAAATHGGHLADT